MLHDHILCAISDEDDQKHLLSEPNLNFSPTLEILCVIEMATHNVTKSHNGIYGPVSFQHEEKVDKVVHKNKENNIGHKTSKEYVSHCGKNFRSSNMKYYRYDGSHSSY